MREYREDFPLLLNRDIVYLDNAATAQRPEAVLRAEREFYEKSNANPHRGIYALGMEATERCEGARETVRNFINAGSAGEIIFTRNATESINLAAYSYGRNRLKAGDEILVTITEHHSNLLPWQMAAEQTGAKLVYLECREDGSIPPEEISRAVTEKTKLAAVAHVSNVLGRVNPVEQIIELVHRNQGVVLLDAAQSMMHQKVDVRELDVDFLAFSGHKMMGPMGIGVLYGKEALLEEMPPFLRGGEMITSVTREGAVYAGLPHKFEAGTVNGAGAAGLAAAIGYIEEIGTDAIKEREQYLTKLAFDGMNRIPGVHILGSGEAFEHCGILSFTLDGVHPHDIASILDEGKIAVRAGHHCAQPLLKHLGVLVSARASIAFYNSEDDIARFLACLEEVRGRMGYAEQKFL